MGECRQTTIQVKIITWCEKHCDVVSVTKIGGRVVTAETCLMYVLKLRNKHLGTDSCSENFQRI